ncbi:hypothetical protein [Yinghuangia seranimata]|uniref:hypothetical protein n=1 Tax=Yinghuangia seranimata TaxID=408067 RepID=UPI00248AE146|nr:hypothetical protein [Yinghuangia seranimata]MDI2128455.1 hypothetical protein [Yinghuangia seranimata]
MSSPLVRNLYPLRSPVGGGPVPAGTAGRRARPAPLLVWSDGRCPGSGQGSHTLVRSDEVPGKKWKCTRCGHRQ